ncbi:MAG: hypothetical protein N7Q72_04225, partial [Spiroplasma sp. Tabriz.8]|nr:hypothetical protein [Spiroplasma sp. Tabriz.8]
MIYQLFFKLWKYKFEYKMCYFCYHKFWEVLILLFFSKKKKKKKVDMRSLINFSTIVSKD